MVDVNRYYWSSAICISLYALSSWITINGLWNEMPLLVNDRPEGWKLPAYVVIIIQIANIGPILYVPFSKRCLSRKDGFIYSLIQPPERLINYLILIFGLLVTILLANFWQSTIQIADNLFSFGLLALTLCVAVVDCTSSVTFYAYLAGTAQAYIGALTFGEAFCDLIPSVMSLIQGVGTGSECAASKGLDSLRFSTTAYIYILAAMLAVSLLAFTLLDNASWGLGTGIRLNYLANQIRLTQSQPTIDRHAVIDDSSIWSHHHQEGDLEHSDMVLVTSLRSKVTSIAGNKRCLNHLGLLLIAYISALTNGFLPSLQSYSTASYSQTTHHLAVNLSGVAVALGILVTTRLVVVASSSTLNRPAWRDNDSGNQSSVGKAWLCLTLASSIPVGYVIYLAASSPNPPWSNSLVGPALAITAWIVARVGFITLRTWIWLTLSSSPTTGSSSSSMTSESPIQLLRLAGLSTQLGALVGSLIGFALIQADLFKAKIVIC